MNKKSIPEISANSKLLYARISKASKGEIITYIELSNIINIDIQKKGRGFLYTAINMALRENELVFEAVHNVGIKCLTDEENASVTGMSIIKKIRRASLKGIRKITSIEDFNILSNHAKIQHNMSLSVMGVMKNMTKPKRLVVIEDQFKTSKLTFDKTVELFK